jgi:hypothetical protein
LTENLREFARQLGAEIRHDPDGRIVIERAGVEIRLRDDGTWELREPLPDGRIAISIMHELRTILWQGILHPGDPDLN